MKKGIKICIVLLVALALGGHALGFGLWNQLQDSAEAWAKRGLRHWLSLQARVEELEDALAVFRQDEGTAEEEDTVTSEVERVTSPDTEAFVTEAATAPSETPTEPDTEAGSLPHTVATEVDTSPAAAYIITAYQGIIGVFDDSGRLIETVNVAVMTLPSADREALAEGIPALGMDEVRKILDRLA